MGISKFWNKKYTYLRQAGFVNYKLEQDKDYYIVDFPLYRLKGMVVNDNRQF